MSGNHILLATQSWVIVLVLLILMILSVYTGYAFGKRVNTGQVKSESDSLLTAGIYTLFGLLLAFTFTMSGERFDSRKQIIIDEANDIGTAVLRAEMYPDSVKVLFREDFKKYLEGRIDYYEAQDDLNKVKQALKISEEYGNRLFSRAAELSLDPAYLAASNQMIPALNAMIDIANERLHGEFYKVPDAIILMILILSVISSFVYGYSTKMTGKNVDWYLVICYCIVSCLVIYFILDLDRSRRGLINVHEMNRAIMDVRRSLE